MPILVNATPEEVVRDMTLFHTKPEYKTNTKRIHWSFLNEQDAKEDKFSLDDFISGCIADPHTLAIWKKDDSYVIAWVDA